MFRIINRLGTAKGSKSVSIIIKKQNSDEKVFNFTLSNLSTAEGAAMIKQILKAYETKSSNSEVLAMLNSIKELSSESEVKRYINELTRLLKT